MSIKLLYPAAFLLLSLSVFRTHNDFKLTGTVKDENGISLPGVIVVEKGRRQGTITGKNGAYAISVQNGNSILEFSYAGYETLEVQIKSQAVINVVLKKLQAKMDEVVVTGISSQPLENGTFYGLQGKVSGVVVSNGNGYYRQMAGKYSPGFNTEEYEPIAENSFHKVSADPLSTFSIDVDAASYSNIRRFLNNDELPPADAVRVEEMINYFHYDYPQPSDASPFSINTEISGCPWNKQHKIVMIGLQGRKIPVNDLPPSNLVFLIDVSGSMDDPMKLPLVQSSMKLLVEQLREEDKISIVVYAGAAGVVLPSTSGANKTKIKEAINNLEAGGSTAGGEGIRLAYKIAKENFKKEGNNRIILCTDGDFNIGVSSNGELEALITKEKESGVFLTVLGFGMGNYKDSKMQLLADKGNGNHAYIDGESEAKKVLVKEFGGTLFTIAKDVKLQIEFNPSKVQGYRLIGYENRMLENEDFNDDKKDAGELGSGHTVTALYEIIPTGIRDEFLRDVDPLKYQKEKTSLPASSGNEVMTVKFRYKEPDGTKTKLIVHPVVDQQVSFEEASENFRFVCSVAEFGLLLHNSEFRSASSFDQVLQTAGSASENDKEGYRKEFIALVRKAAVLKKEDKDLTKK